MYETKLWMHRVGCLVFYERWPLARGLVVHGAESRCRILLFTRAYACLLRPIQTDANTPFVWVACIELQPRNHPKIVEQKLHPLTTIPVISSASGFLHMFPTRDIREHLVKCILLELFSDEPSQLFSFLDPLTCIPREHQRPSSALHRCCTALVAVRLQDTPSQSQERNLDPHIKRSTGRSIRNGKQVMRSALPLWTPTQKSTEECFIKPS